MNKLDFVDGCILTAFIVIYSRNEANDKEIIKKIKTLRSLLQRQVLFTTDFGNILFEFVYSIFSMKSRLGAHYRVSGSVGTEQDINVAQIISHENYQRPKSFSNDIALLKLSKPASLGRGVGLVCLSNPSNNLPIDDPNKKCYITGWGTLSPGGSQPNVLMQASVPLVSRSRCLKAYPQKIDDTMLCAGLDKGGIDACQGDSGGPLVCEFNGKWFLEGATSWGHGCAAPNKYGVYASVKTLRKWVLSKTGTIVQPTPPPPVTPPPPPG